jgi:putative oxidoreductase
MSNNIFSRWQSAAPFLLSLLRIAAALMFMTSGSIKLFAYPIGMPPNGATAELLTEVGIGGILEFFGGFLMLIGLCTRPVAFILAGEMAVAYFQYHYPASPWPAVNNGTGAVLFCFIWFYISAAGPGPFSVDALMKRRP